MAGLGVIAAPAHLDSSHLERPRESDLGRPSTYRPAVAVIAADFDLLQMNAVIRLNRSDLGASGGETQKLP
jgi:hypothetical protein